MSSDSEKITAKEIENGGQPVKNADELLLESLGYKQVKKPHTYALYYSMLTFVH